jgi:adenylate cyclase
VLFRNNLRLKPSILTAFAFLTIPVFFTIIAVTYFSNDSIARASARELVERFRIDALESIEDDFNPLKSLIRSAASLGEQDPGFYLDNRSLKYFYSILQHSPKIVSVYVGLNDGALREARRVDPQVMLQGKLPPPGASYAYRWLVPKTGSPAINHYVFLDANQKELVSTDEATAYDPRVRPWYRAAEEARAMIISDPDVFASEAVIGVTVAAPFYGDGMLLGVAAADITLGSLGAYLAERRISPGTLSYLLDHQGQVIAASDLSNTSTTDHGNVELRHVSSLDNPLPALAFSARPRQGEGGVFSFRLEGKEYLASLSNLAAEFGKTWQILTITPLSDFTGPFQANNNRLVIFGLLAVAVQIVIIYFLTSVISAPLEKLAFKVGRIEELGSEQLPSVISPIREISVLSKAIDTLDVAVKSFSAFVPVGLVRELLQSEQKLELGGHSRFLTIFFSDLEAFSTLSEQVPSQELLLRVSAYLELVTKTVNQELGTIDKFIGDGVMAFWGAPAILEDHAWRACVAALRIQRGIDALNERWQADGMKSFRIRIGIHSDAVMVGNIGSRERMSYTVMGDGVNIASRLEGINKEFGTRTCISHSVFKEAGERLCVRPIDDVTVKGRRSKIPIYELLGVFGADDPELEPDAAMLELCRMTRAAYEALIKGDNALAQSRYRAILAEFPDDPVASNLVKRLVTA